ncbi:MAG: hypothetical protein MUF26_03620 [Syntrophales bacterium]|nr:hypothetical protein [Syntrophales bacterium]
MAEVRSGNRLRSGLLVIFFLFFTGVGSVSAQSESAAKNPAASLRAKYVLLRDQFGHNSFQRPLYMDSGEKENRLRGEIHAVVDYSFVTAASALKHAPAWCDILSLHLNIKYCRVQTNNFRQTLLLYIGRKYEQPLEKATPVEFTFSTAESSPGYLRVVLNSQQGPFGTQDYKIQLEAVPVERDRTFIRLSYAYETSLIAKLAMQCYLNTLGSDKVGFTVVGNKSDGRPVYAGDMRGVVERNTMRYYLAVEAYLCALSVPEDQRLDARLQNWFAATERYSLQLHEIDRAAYLAMKHREHQRQLARP